jgi:cell division protein FtsB
MEERNIFFQTTSRLHLVLAGAAFLLLLTGYIVQVNASSTKAYALHDATAYHEELLRSQDRLVAEIDRLRSLSSVIERKAFLDLVPVQRVSYILSTDVGAVALR